MILEYVLNPANLIFIFFCLLEEKEHHSRRLTVRMCVFYFFFKGAQTAFSLLIRAVLFQKMYLLFMFPIFPAGKHMLSFRLGKLQCHVKTT